MIPFFVSSPHSGEQVPSEVKWLNHLPEAILMCDVDRFVDQFYHDFCEKRDIPFISTPWHRYVADLNRLPEDVDRDSVVNHKNAGGSHTTGLHWVKTTQGDVLMKKPISVELHNLLVAKYHRPFHQDIEAQYLKGLQVHKKFYQLDAHSMPSKGAVGGAHRDPGELRAQVVVSDQDGQSCSRDFRDLVANSYQQAGFEVRLNWPYKGGRVTQTYGQPRLGQHCIQVELNRSLYMDEQSKHKLDGPFLKTKEKISKALGFIAKGIVKL